MLRVRYPFGVPLHPLAGPEAQVDMHPECVLHMGVRLMRDVNEVEDKYGPMTAAPGSGSDPQGRRRTAQGAVASAGPDGEGIKHYIKKPPESNSEGRV